MPNKWRLHAISQSSPSVKRQAHSRRSACMGALRVQCASTVCNGLGNLPALRDFYLCSSSPASPAGMGERDTCLMFLCSQLYIRSSRESGRWFRNTEESFFAHFSFAGDQPASYTNQGDRIEQSPRTTYLFVGGSPEPCYSLFGLLRTTFIMPSSLSGSFAP